MTLSTVRRTFVQVILTGKGRWYAASGYATCPYCKGVIIFKESANEYRAMTGQYDVSGSVCSHFIGLSRPRGHSATVAAFHRLGKGAWRRS